ncbi:MAG: threonine synthase [Oscillospiraceae bacterium]
MKYISTRGCDDGSDAARAILRGLAPDGGLFVPSEIPAFTESELELLKTCSYESAATLVFKKYLVGFSDEEIACCVHSAYGSGAFEDCDVIDITTCGNGTKILELWHGPTCAFKDVALQALPTLLVQSAKKCGERDKIAVLVATSGDTGKAALEGFRDVPGTSVTVLYPKDGVGELQRRQMVTQRGENVRVIAVRGNFDDAQSAVKRVFSDAHIASSLETRGVKLSSANSINWGRLLPQIVYYALASERLSAAGERVDFAVPTGNFGNILAAYYAKRMGAPVGTLICASNANNVLTDFIESGVYDRNRPFYKTLSPSMDILVSSNLERLLFELSGRDCSAVSGFMRSLSDSGRYNVGETLSGAVRELFYAGCCSDTRTRETIKRVWREHGYLADPHTATALAVREDFARERGYKTAVVASTASAFKFPAAVYSALFGGHELSLMDDYDALQQLSCHTELSIPSPLRSLGSLPTLHCEECSPDELSTLLAETL